MQRHWSKQVIVRMKNFLKGYQKNLDRRRRRLLPEIFRGVLRSGSLRLADIGRAAKRHKESLWAIEKRLSRQMRSQRWDHRILQEELLRQMAHRVKPWMEVAIDITDAAKPRAEKMEGLGYVYDGSRKEEVTGYWLFESYAVINKGKLLPLLCFAFSLNLEGVASQNYIVEQACIRLKEALDDNGVFLLDRGFDRGELLRVFEEHKINYIMRIRGDRNVLSASGEDIGSVQEVMRRLPDRWRCRLSQRASVCCLNWQEIRLPGQMGRYWLVVLRMPGSGREPLLLLTNLEADCGIDAERVARRYFMRWAAEDAARFMKQEVGLESFLVRSFCAIEKLITIAFMVMAFFALLAELPKATIEKIERLGLSFKKDVDFLYYRITWGLKAFLDALRPLPPIRTG